MNTARFSAANAASLLSRRGGDTGEGGREIDVLGLLRTLWRGKWIILGVVAVMVAVTAVYVFLLATPLYTATAEVALQNRDEQIVDFESVMSGLGSDQASVNTEVEVLQSRGLVDKLVERLDLESDPEFNLYLDPPDPWSAEGLWAWISGADRLPPPSPRMVRDKTVSEVLDALAITNVRQSYVFDITVRTEDPTKSALMADTLAELYILDQLEVKFKATEQATEWLTDRVGQLKDELQKAENAVKTFNAGTELISADRLEAMNVQLKDFRDRYDNLVAEQAAEKKRVAELEAAAASGDTARMARAAGQSDLKQMQARLADGTASDRAEFEQRFRQVLDRARFEAKRGLSQVDTMAASIKDLEAQVASQSEDLVKLEQLEREADASKLIYEYFLSRLKETSVQQGIQQADSRVLSHAMLPVDPSSPQEALLLGLAAVIGLLAGSVLVILTEMRNNAFRTAEELERETGAVVIGQVPRAPTGRRKRVLEYIVSKPTSALVEAVRNLRTSILLSNIDNAPKVIVLTSSVPGEGKSTLSLALAQNLAGINRRVLVIEGDMRRRTFREFFDLGDGPGLLSTVAGEVAFDKAVHHHPELGLDILIGERSAINAADFFSSERFGRFIAEVRDTYDFIIIDTPPVLVVPDARVIAQSADAVIYVVHWDSTPRRQVIEGIRSFAMVNVPVTGLVLSQIDSRGMRSYGYTGSYGYGYGYSKSYYDS